MSNELNIERPLIKSLKDLRNVYFIGIGGIGMSAIARYFHSIGVLVSGYDKTKTELTSMLESEGIKIHYQEDINLIPKEADLIVYTPAIPKDHKELLYFQENHYNIVKRSDVLQAISTDSFNICVAGTHGKTTISTLIAHILRNSGFGCNAFLGGISVNYNTNFWSSPNKVSVIEADEYDRSFLKLSPDLAIISAMDADHLDIYGTENAMQDAFISFGNKVKADGLLLSKFGLPRIKEVRSSRKMSYSLQNESSDAFASDIKMEDGGYTFDVQVNSDSLSELRLNIGGMHNIENAVAAISIARELKISDEKIRESLTAFKGVRRRFEYVIAPEKKIEGRYIKPILIDDYAHHPEELKALLKSVRSLFPQRSLTVVFQPHLYSRTRDLAEGFAEALSIADTALVIPIYPAREKPIEGVSSEIITSKIPNHAGKLLDKDGILDWMKEHVKNLNKEFGEVFVMAGAGDIDSLVKPVKEIIEKA